MRYPPLLLWLLTGLLVVNTSFETASFNQGSPLPPPAPRFDAATHDTTHVYRLVRQAVRQADVIVEAEVIEDLPAIKDEQRGISTPHRLRVIRQLKGCPVPSVLQVLTPGGWVGAEGLQVSHAVQVGKGATGLFVLRNPIQGETAPQRVEQALEPTDFFTYADGKAIWSSAGISFRDAVAFTNWLEYLLKSAGN